MATLKLRVTGMTCGHCQMKVEKALQGASGVYSAIVDLATGEAEVDFNDDSATSEQLVRAVQAAGDRKSTRLNSSHLVISYAVFCLKKKKKHKVRQQTI